MRPAATVATLVLALVASLPHRTAQAQPPLLSGDVRLACEALLCLSTASAPAACRPALTRYFDIRPRKLSDMLRQRLNFLRLCPVSAQTPVMQSWVSALARAAGRCDATSLNIALSIEGSDGRRVISDQLPDYCLNYFSHALVAGSLRQPLYVGSPEQGGFWAEATAQASAEARYREQIANRNAQRLDGKTNIGSVR